MDGSDVHGFGLVWGGNISMKISTQTVLVILCFNRNLLALWLLLLATLLAYFVLIQNDLILK